RCYPRPVRPRELRDGIDLGAIAVASPYACYLRRTPAGGFSWDFRVLAPFECHAGLHSPAVEVDFALDDTGRLQAERIRYEGRDARRGDRDWDLAQRLAMCGAANHLSLVRHFGGVHLAAGTAMALAA